MEKIEEKFFCFFDISTFMLPAFFDYKVRYVQFFRSRERYTLRRLQRSYLSIKDCVPALWRSITSDENILRAVTTRFVAAAWKMGLPGAVLRSQGEDRDYALHIAPGVSCRFSITFAASVLAVPLIRSYGNWVKRKAHFSPQPLRALPRNASAARGRECVRYSRLGAAYVAPLSNILPCNLPKET